MDDLGNILYILVMLGALIFSAFRKQKQAKRPQPMPEDEHRPTYSPMDEDDVLSELKDLFNQPKEQPRPVVEQPPVQKAVIKPPVQTVHKEKPKSKHSKNDVELEDLNTTGDGFEFDKEQIDLRQAVIYSEILKRPYE